MSDQEFTVTIRPTRKGFRRADKPEGPAFLRLWEGHTSKGERFALLSYGAYGPVGPSGFDGFDYTPVDLSQLEIVPEDEPGEVMKAVGKLLGE